MANITGVDGTITIAGNVVAELKSFSIERSGSTIANHTLNSTSESYKAGRTGWTAQIECQWDEADTAQLAMVEGTELACIFLPEGNTIGDISYSGTAIITSNNMAVADESIVTKQFSLQGSGPLVAGVVA